MACAARGAGLTVGLIAQERPAPGATSALDARVYTLSPANAAFLRELRAWDLVDASRLTPVHAMRVYGDRGQARLDFDAYRAGVPELAWTLEDSILQTALWRAAEAREGVHVFAPAECEALDNSPGRVHLRLRDGRELTASLAVGADGAGSFVRRQAGIEVTASDYGDAAVVANFACAKPHG